MSPETQRLVEAASGGDAGAVEALLERNLPRLRAYVRMNMGRLLRAKEQSCDLVQSVCREVLQGVGKHGYRGETGFRKWLFQTALHKIIDRARYYAAEKRDAKLEVPVPEDPASSTDADVLRCYQSFCTPSRHAMAREAMDEVEQAMDELPEAYKRIIILSLIEERPHKEIAEELGRSIGATRVLLYRSLSRLRMLLETRRAGEAAEAAGSGPDPDGAPGR